MTTNIYCLFDPITNQPRYIGKSDNILKRLNEHIIESSKNTIITHKVNWIKSLLNKKLKPIIEVIDIVDNNQWQFWEKYYISLYKSWGFNLTNLTEGGDGASYGVLNHMFGKFGKDNPNYGRKNNSKTIDLMKLKASGSKNGFYNKKHTSKSLDKISKASQGCNNVNYGGVLHTKEYLIKQSISNSKVPIKIKDLLDNKEYSFINSTEAALFLNVTSVSIRKAKNKYKLNKRYIITDDNNN